MYSHTRLDCKSQIVICHAARGGGGGGRGGGVVCGKMRSFQGNIGILIHLLFLFSFLNRQDARGGGGVRQKRPGNGKKTVETPGIKSNACRRAPGLPQRTRVPGYKQAR